jgi:hypothetical protein
MAGEYDSPVIGPLQVAEVKLKWRTLTEEGCACSRRCARPSRSTARAVPGLHGGRCLTHAEVAAIRRGKLEPGKVMAVEMDVELD